MTYLHRLHLLRFNRWLSMFWLTLQKAKGQLMGFVLLFSFIFTAFVCLFYLNFLYSFDPHKHVLKWFHWNLKYQKIWKMLIFFLHLYVFWFLSLLSYAFLSICLFRLDIMKENDQYEMFQFIQNKIYQWLGQYLSN